MEMILNLFIVILTFSFMEFVAWFTHKYIMHGILWYLHKDHHQPNDKSIFEKNDYFFLIFAIPGFLAIFIGIENNMNFLFWIGIGITLYGLAYFFVHDVFIHQRIRILKNTKNKYLRSVRKAHKVHHQNRNKEDGECFGMLVVPYKFKIRKKK